MTTLSYKDREKRRRERAILLAARHLIHESGYVGLNMDTLADAVGISKPTLYQHFRSKDDLIVRVIVDGIEEVEDYLLSTTEESPLERLKMALRLILSNRYGVDGPLTDFETELITSSLYAHADVIAVKKRVMTEANRVVEAGKARGEIIPTIPTTLVSCLLFKLIGLPATLQGVLSSDPPRPVDAETLTVLNENIIAMFVRSIAQETSPR